MSQYAPCAVKGEGGTFDYRLFLQEGGHTASFWHDIPLDNGDGTVNFVCEIPKETRAKMEVATVSLSEVARTSCKVLFIGRFLLQEDSAFFKVCQQVAELQDKGFDGHLKSCDSLKGSGWAKLALAWQVRS